MFHQIPGKEFLTGGGTLGDPDRGPEHNRCPDPPNRPLDRFRIRILSRIVQCHRKGRIIIRMTTTSGRGGGWVAGASHDGRSGGSRQSGNGAIVPAWNWWRRLVVQQMIRIIVGTVTFDLIIWNCHVQSFCYGFSKKIVVLMTIRIDCHS